MNLINLADWVNNNLFEAHRGAIKLGKNFVLFGNDGISNPATLAEVEYVFKWLRERKHKVLGFGTDAEHFTWVVVFQPSRRVSEVDLTTMLFDGWDCGIQQLHPHIEQEYAGVYRMFQTQIALEQIASTPVPKSLTRWVKELSKETTNVLTTEKR